LKKLFRKAKRFFKSKVFKIIAAVALAWIPGSAAYSAAFWKTAAISSSMGVIKGAAITAGLAAGGAVIGSAYGLSVTGTLKGAIYGGLAGAAVGSMIGGVVTGALSGGPIGLAKSVGHQIANHFARRFVSRVAERNGWSTLSVNISLLAFSFAGNKIVGSRLWFSNANSPEIHGILSRRPGGLIDRLQYPLANKMVGLAFDTADILLGYQGMPTATWFDYINVVGYGESVAAHSLGTLDASNMAGLGLVSNARLYSLPFGNTAPGNSRLTIGGLDVVNGGVIGKLLNPVSEISWKNYGVVKHRWSCYLWVSCKAP
jgi:hypothetical protein